MTAEKLLQICILYYQYYLSKEYKKKFNLRLDNERILISPFNGKIFTHKRLKYKKNYEQFSIASNEKNSKLALSLNNITNYKQIQNQKQFPTNN